MSKVTALHLDTVTEQSGHVATPLAVSVCTTPAAPSPVPVPYPALGNTAEGIKGAPLRTKVNGAKMGTVGSALSACHGNEPGSMKETLSLNTSGTCPVLMGAPVVLCELGMMGVTGSPVMMNRGAGSTARTAPAPALTGAPGMCPGTLIQGGGAGSGGGNGDGAGDGGGDNGAGAGSGGEGAGGDGRNAPPGKPGQCSGGHPVDVVTGRAYTLPAVDLQLPGPLPLVFARTYSTAMADRDMGLGFGWAHSWGWTLEVKRHAITVWTEDGISVDFPSLPSLDEGELIGPWGWSLRATADYVVLDTADGLHRYFSKEGEQRRLLAVADRNDNATRLIYDEDDRLEWVEDSAGRVHHVKLDERGRMLHLRVYTRADRSAWIHAGEYSYDDEGDLIRALDAEGHATTYAYDDQHRLTRETTRTGLTFCFVYDARGRCVETWGERDEGTDPSLAEGVPSLLADHETRAKGIYHCLFDYHDDTYTEVTDSTHVRRYWGNAHGLVDKAIEAAGVETYTYDERGVMLSWTNGHGATTHYEVDAASRLVRETDPLGRSYRYERDGWGLPTRIEDPRGGVTILDGCGSIETVVVPTG